ncbi:Very Early Transcript [Caenorhabditis elegans]|uniref:Very Early Transcript n=1 Tax=Caenorhabditis elegans TaxID=6239 RepID=O01861_CAEEL|nr:Very Early Transcript [Caenorhabditis elegans]CCD73364.2 Very Early Transcript [Caenorhabditis elegans]|eukprot:NP_491787.2 Very Early Transcript [Caenorhabditis elegans]
MFAENPFFTPTESKLKSEIALLQMKLDDERFDHQKTRRELANSRLEISDLKGEAKCHDSELNRLYTIINNLEKKVEDLNGEHQKSLEKLKERLHEKDAFIEACEEFYDEKKINVNKMTLMKQEMELKRIKKNFEEYKERMTEVEKNLNEFIKRQSAICMGVRYELNMEKDSRERYFKEAQQLKQEKDVLVHEINEREVRILCLRSDILTLKSENNDTSKELDEMKNGTKALKHELEETKKMKSEALSKYEESQKEFEQFNLKFQRLCTKFYEERVSSQTTSPKMKEHLASAKKRLSAIKETLQNEEDFDETGEVTNYQ